MLTCFDGRAYCDLPWSAQYARFSLVCLGELPEWPQRSTYAFYILHIMCHLLPVNLAAILEPSWHGLPGQISASSSS
jgi:hypothetical protein